MKLSIDRQIYSDACISKVAYWLSAQYAIERTLDGTNETLSISRNDGQPFDEAELRSQCLQLLNDYKLRQTIDDETRDIRTILYAKAFADDENLTAE